MRRSLVCSCNCSRKSPASRRRNSCRRLQLPLFSRTDQRPRHLPSHTGRESRFGVGRPAVSRCWSTGVSVTERSCNGQAGFFLHGGGHASRDVTSFGCHPECTVGDLRLILGMRHPHYLVDYFHQSSEGLKDDFRALEIAKDCTFIFELHIYSDGSADQSKSWPRKTLSAGWSAVFFFNFDPMEVRTLVGAVGGQVVTVQTAAMYIGAETCSNNTAELSAVVVPLWLLLGILTYQPLHLWLDSKYTIDMVEGRCRLSCIASSFKMLVRLSTCTDRIMGCVSPHVRSHTNNTANEFADRIADFARRGVTINVSVCCAFACCRCI